MLALCVLMFGSPITAHNLHLSSALTTLPDPDFTPLHFPPKPNHAVQILVARFSERTRVMKEQKMADAPNVIPNFWKY